MAELARILDEIKYPRILLGVIRLTIRVEAQGDWQEFPVLDGRLFCAVRQYDDRTWRTTTMYYNESQQFESGFAEIVIFEREADARAQYALVLRDPQSYAVRLMI